MTTSERANQPTCCFLIGAEREVRDAAAFLRRLLEAEQQKPHIPHGKSIDMVWMDSKHLSQARHLPRGPVILCGLEGHLEAEAVARFLQNHATQLALNLDDEAAVRAASGWTGSKLGFSERRPEAELNGRCLTRRSWGYTFEALTRNELQRICLPAQGVTFYGALSALAGGLLLGFSLATLASALSCPSVPSEREGQKRPPVLSKTVHHPARRTLLVVFLAPTQPLSRELCRQCLQISDWCAFVGASSCGRGVVTLEQAVRASKAVAKAGDRVYFRMSEDLMRQRETAPCLNHNLAALHFE